MAKFFVLAAVALCLAFAEAKKKQTVKTECRSVDYVAYDEVWFDTHAIVGFDNVMGSKLKVGQGLSGPPTPPENKSLAFHECWSMKMRTKVGLTPVPMSFRYDVPFSRSVILKTEGTEVAQLLRFFGNFVVTKTDNKTYLVGYGCLSEKTPTWTVMSPLKTKISKDDKKEILEHVENDLGFEDLKTNQKNKNDPLAFADMVQVVCHASSTKATVTSLLGKKKGGSAASKDDATEDEE